MCLSNFSGTTFKTTTLKKYSRVPEPDSIPFTSPKKIQTSFTTFSTPLPPSHSLSSSSSISSSPINSSSSFTSFSPLIPSSPFNTLNASTSPLIPFPNKHKIRNIPKHIKFFNSAFKVPSPPKIPELIPQEHQNDLQLLEPQTGSETQYFSDTFE
ncbi:hypothetical protein HMI56_002740 [Coelomomyces lativittatus]|nr:hypothetical protein HMI56_002740 [Coelomomyces lativittatus]